MNEKSFIREEHKKKKMGIAPFLLFSSFIIIVAVMVIAVLSQSADSKNGKDSSAQDKEGEVVTDNVDKQLLSVLKEHNIQEKRITLLDVQSGQDVVLKYTGGTSIVDKYDQDIAASQLQIGDLVDAYYYGDSNKLAKLQLSNTTWEYKGINNWIHYTKEGTIKVVDTTYKYINNVVVVRDGKLLGLEELDEKDEIIIHGLNKEVYSIQVTKGHGTLQFEDYADFIGGTAYIGKKEILPVVEDMVIMVQEGIYDIKFEKGSLVGNKKVSVRPEDSIIVNLGEFKKPPVETGMVQFIITPEGADLIIDNQLWEYDDPIELEYGEHNIKVTLGGYTTFSGDLKVDEKNKTIAINLVETNTSDQTDLENVDSSDEEDSIDSSEDESQTDNETNNNNSGNNDSDDNGSDSNGSDGAGNDNTDNVTDMDNNKGYINIETPEGASVYFNGQYKGTSPVRFGKEIGTHYITLIKAGYVTKTYTVEISDDGKTADFDFPELTIME